MNSPTKSAKADKPSKSRNYLEVILDNPAWGNFRSLSGHKIIDSGLVIALFTVVAYFLTYVYEMNYLGYFGASTSGVRVDIESLLLSTFLLITFTGVITFLLYELLTFSAPRDSNLKSLLSGLLFVGLIFVFLQMPFLYAAGPASFWGRTVNYLIAFGVMTSMLVLIAGVGELGNKLLIWRNILSKDELQRSREAHGEQVVRASMPLLLPAVALGVFMYTCALGTLMASSARSFQLISFNGKEGIVLREYRDHAVAVAYDSKSNKVLDTFVYIPYNDKPLEYRVIHVHPQVKGQQSSSQGPQDVIAEWAKQQYRHITN